MDDPNKRMVWIDLEMTGLDLERESIIEIATIITDSELNIIAEGPNLAISVSEELIEGMDEWNTRHHFGSGLIDRVRNDSVSLKEAERQTLDFIKQNGFTMPLPRKSKERKPGENPITEYYEFDVLKYLFTHHKYMNDSVRDEFSKNLDEIVDTTAVSDTSGTSTSKPSGKDAGKQLLW